MSTSLASPRLDIPPPECGEGRFSEKPQVHRLENADDEQDTDSEQSHQPEEPSESYSEPSAANYSEPAAANYSPKEVENAMTRAQIRAQAFVNRPASTDSLNGQKQWPPLARKKSGELVKSSLRHRPPLARTKSEPTRKAVHFNQKLEDVRPFRESQRPCAVNPASRKPQFRTGGDHTGNSSENEEDLYDEDDDDEEDGWTLLTPGFVPHRYGGVTANERPVVYLETLQLTSDKSTVAGSVYVKNMAFSKHVAVRYTMDNWKTFSETQAVWNDDIRKHDRDAGYDRFDMTLSLRCFSPKVLCDTVMFLCVRYNVNGEEYWDNNNGANYELYLRNSELLHALQNSDNEKNKNNSSASWPSLSRHRSEDPVQITKSDSVKEILSNALRDTEDDNKSPLSGPPGIPMKRHNGADKSRYSFEASLTMPPQSQAKYSTGSPQRPHSRYNVSLVQQLARSWSPYETAVPMPSELKDNERSGSMSGPSKLEPRVASDDPEKFHAWESESYKDFVSKYCFYTPRTDASSTKVKPKPTHDIARESPSRDESSETDTSSGSSDVDLSARRGITLAPERGTSRV